MELPGKETVLPGRWTRICKSIDSYKSLGAERRVWSFVASQGMWDGKRIMAGKGDWGRPHRAGTSHEEIVLLLAGQGEPFKNSSVFRSSSHFPVRVSRVSAPRTLYPVDNGKQCDGGGGVETFAAALTL